MKNIKLIYFLCLLLSVAMFWGCNEKKDEEPPDLTGYYGEGHIWTLEYDPSPHRTEKMEFSVELVDIAEDRVTIRIFNMSVDMINTLEYRNDFSIFSKMFSFVKQGYSKAVIDGVEYYPAGGGSEAAKLDPLADKHYYIHIPNECFDNGECVIDLYYEKSADYTGLAKISYQRYAYSHHDLFIFLY